jgi:hypothetical protein
MEARDVSSLVDLLTVVRELAGDAQSPDQAGRAAS